MIFSLHLQSFRLPFSVIGSWLFLHITIIVVVVVFVVLHAKRGDDAIRHFTPTPQFIKNRYGIFFGNAGDKIESPLESDTGNAFGIVVVAAKKAQSD